MQRLLRAAMVAVEARTGKILLSRDFLWVIDGWRNNRQQGLPVVPVNAVTSVTTVDRGGTRSVSDQVRYALVPDSHWPWLVPTGAGLPAIPCGGVAEIVLQAGYGATWEAIPADLAQAVLLLAAHYHDNRSEDAGAPGLLPRGVNTLIQRYKTVRLLGGRA